LLLKKRINAIGLIDDDDSLLIIFMLLKTLG